jgi:hypothetical protein
LNPHGGEGQGQGEGEGEGEGEGGDAELGSVAGSVRSVGIDQTKAKPFMMAVPSSAADGWQEQHEQGQ